MKRFVSGVLALACATEWLAGSTLLAHWKLDEAAPPYADASLHAAALGLDPVTTRPLAAGGVSGLSAGLNWENPPGTATRLAAYGEQLQSDSFGFSFWVGPDNLAPFDNLIGKEMLASNVGPEFSRLAWNVQVGANDGSGAAPLVLVVRGTERGTTDFHGSVTSAVKVPLYQSSGNWYHVAGGYNANSGRLQIHVNGVEASAQGTSGAKGSDGGAFVVGSMINDGSFIAYAGMADIDEVQLYSDPLTRGDAAWLLANPSQSVASAVIPVFAGSLVAHWKLNDAGFSFDDWSGNLNALELDQETSSPSKLPGTDGDGLLINWREAEGVSTRLYASGDSLQTDSFGFSFWMKPSRLSPGENLIAKEMAPAGGPTFARLAWQVQVGQDPGTGTAPLELVVRGGDRSDGDFFGSVITAISLPLYAAADEWVHVAGGYDAASGALCIFLNGRKSVNRGRPGAWNSDGSWFNVGSVRNGLDFVAFGAIAAVDDIQLYNAPLSAYEVTYLRKSPGVHITPGMHFKTTGFAGGGQGDQFVTFNSHPGWFYTVETSTTLGSFVPVVTIAATDPSTTARLSNWQLDSALGSAPRPRLFLRVRALIEDPVDGTVEFPPAEILPFANPAAYVPQYHFSWPNAPVGDPNGVVRYDGRYHLFTWDHASSGDLVSWDGEGWPLGSSPPNSDFWTGSVVVDKNNTSGFGSLASPPMVAIYTIHNNVTQKETIGISYSTNHRDFIPYGGNPVLSTGDTLFRDPDVFWDVQTNRWILLVARSAARSIRFYHSSDLKVWHYLSDFGPEGAANEIWECPGLAQVPVRGGGNQKKWLLHVGGGTNKVQYWVGNFDGTHFTMDDATRSFLKDGVGIDGELFSDFEREDFWDAGWTYTGSAFGDKPARREWNPVAKGYLGQRLASSYVDGDWHTGSTLTSAEFTITRNCINFLIGGGNHPGQTCINLLVDGNLVRTATGDDSDLLRWSGWDVAEFKGRSARLQIVDDFGGFWGRIYIDQIMVSDILTAHRREHANWVEFGPDFFAPKFVRDFDGTEQDVKWVGWIGNWEYEQNRPVPENWGKGADSIFRRLQLVWSPQGYQLAQQPIQELQKLRGPVVNVLPRRIRETVPLQEFQPATNTYELEAVFNIQGAGRNFGLNLCNGGTQRVVVGYDAATSNLYIDRRSSGYVTMHPAFARVYTSPFKPTGDQLKLRVFVDQSSIEVFADDGQRVMTAQIYPDPAGTGVELFSFGGETTLHGLRAWPLASIQPH